nr:amidase domain-containing protein [Cohnella thermotolerans]
MPDRESGWQQALVDYVNAVNEDGLSGQAGTYRRVPDPEHRARLMRKYEAASDRRRPLRAKRVRSEIRARLLRKAEKATEAECDVQLHLLHSYEQESLSWQEERLERERIRFIRAGSRWRIDRIEPLATERREEAWPVHEAEAGEGFGWGGRTVIPSVPYINPAAMTAFKSKVLAGPGAAGGGPGEGWFDPSRRGTPYRREETVAYADRWWGEYNPAYEGFEVNCTNYVSQCIFAGGAPMNYTGRRESGWWYKGRVNGQELWSYSWAVAHGLQNYLSRPRSWGLRAELVESPRQLMLGDVICYDWDGNGRFQHNTVVTAFTPDGMPLVNANTISSRHRYWDYRDSYAWTERTQYRFFHIVDEF